MVIPRTPRSRALLGLSALLAPLLVAAPLAAQDVQYETRTRVEFMGALGGLMRLASRAGGAPSESVDTTYIKGARMRTDEGGVSTIIDLEAGRMIHVDHGARTYSSFTFAEMAERMSAAVDQASAQAAAQPAPSPTDPTAENTFTFRFSADATGERERIAGYDAQRALLTLEAEQRVEPGADPAERGGTLVVLMDVWNSPDMPGLTAPANDELAREMTRAGGSFAETLAAAFQDDPSLRAGLERAGEELQKMEGVPMRSVSHFVMVAPEERFDRQLALAGPPERPEGPSVAQQAGRAVLGGVTRGLGARLGVGGGQTQPEPEPAEEPTQLTIVRITSEIQNVHTGTLALSLFEAPAGYREVAFPMP